MAVPLGAILGADGTAAPAIVPVARTALGDFLARDAIGNPGDAREIGRPVNGPAGSDPIPGAYPGDLEDAHAKIIRWFEEAERASIDARDASERDFAYYSGEQWTAEELAALRKRGQPAITINYVRRKVELLSGLERKSRTDPVAYPRTPTEEERADAATQALRYIADDCNMPAVRSAVYQNMLIQGFGGAELGLEDDGKGGANITITHVGWERLWHDPHARAADFNDARYLGLVLWMDRDQLQDMYPDADDVIGDAFSEHFGSYEDKPGVVMWRDNTRERVRVVQCYFREKGDWWGATISRAGFLAEPQQSPFLDRKGRSACPLLLQSAYVDAENNRYGAVRDLISLQDEINKRRSKALHLLSVNRVIAEAGSVDDEDHARREIAKPDGFVTINPGLKFEVMNGGDLAKGQFDLLQHATGEMQASGPNASMAGNDPRELSGRAIIAQQQGGAAQNEPLADSLREWSRRVFEMCWMAARKYWVGERWVRVTDDLGATKWVGINRQITLRDELAAMPEQQRAATMQQMQLMPGDPRLTQVVRTENDVSDLEVDVTIEEGQDVPAMQAEQFQQLAQLAASMPGLIPPDVLIAASSLKNKAELLERMKAASEAQAKAQQAQQPIMQAEAAAGVAVKQSQAALNEARANDLHHGTISKIAHTEKMVTEAPFIPVGPVGDEARPPPPPGRGPPA